MGNPNCVIFLRYWRITYISDFNPCSFFVPETKFFKKSKQKIINPCLRKVVTKITPVSI